MSHVFGGGHVLLYHGIFEDIPPGLESRVHNVSPKDFKEQITWLKQNFDLVTLEEFASADKRRGLAAVTFDDAYRSVFTNAIPWLIDQGIPASIFVNSALIEGDIFWRDKVRFLIGNGLVDDFLDYSAHALWVSKIRPEKFYRDSKRPELNSKLIAGAIDQFLRGRELLDLAADQLGGVIASSDDLVSHPLITYGNHSQAHFVLSSLTDDQQHVEIGQCQSWLRQSGLALCDLFAAPFGGSNDVNEKTHQILKDLGVSGLVMSRKRLNPGAGSQDVAGVKIIERYMVPSTLAQLQALARELECG